MELTRDQQLEIEEAREAVYSTRRPTTEGIEQELHKVHPVLDHGFVRVVDYMGDDAAVVQAARVSYGRGTKRLNEDKALITYLVRNWHTTPFEMAEIKLHVKLPIFVARQWIRHRTASVNEYSARYSVLDNEFYVPAHEQLAAQSTTNRQGRSDMLSAEEGNEVLDLIRSESNRAYGNYSWLLNEDTESTARDPSRIGLARELARMNLTLNTYTQWYWKIDLHNLLNFLRLRADAHAQYEIRAYANVLLGIVARWVPLTHAAYEEHRLHGTHLSRTAIKIISAALSGDDFADFRREMSAREWDQLVATFPRLGRAQA